MNALSITTETGGMMNDELDQYAVQVAQWVQAQVTAREAKFPGLRVLKQAVTDASAKVAAASSDEDRALALEQQSKAIWAEITAFPQ